MIPGDLFFTTRGIAEIQSYYMEDDLQKVRFWLHSVDKTDGVTATGEALLMSTTPNVLQVWIDNFPRDLAERRRSVTSHDVLNRIDQAKVEGPRIKASRLQAEVE